MKLISLEAPPCQWVISISLSSLNLCETSKFKWVSQTQNHKMQGLRESPGGTSQFINGIKSPATAPGARQPGWESWDIRQFPPLQNGIIIPTPKAVRIKWENAHKALVNNSGIKMKVRAHWTHILWLLFAVSSSLPLKIITMKSDIRLSASQ